MFLIHSTAYQAPLQSRFLHVLVHRMFGDAADCDQIPGFPPEAITTSGQRLDLGELMTRVPGGWPLLALQDPNLSAGWCPWP